VVGGWCRVIGTPDTVYDRRLSWTSHVVGDVNQKAAKLLNVSNDEGLLRVQRIPHRSNRRFTAKPEFERSCALVKQHG